MENHGEILAPTLRDSSDQNNEWISVSETWRQTSLTSALALIPPWSIFLWTIQLLGILSKKTDLHRKSQPKSPAFILHLLFFSWISFPIQSWVSAMILHEKEACFPFQMCTAPNTNGKKSWRPPCSKSNWVGERQENRSDMHTTIWPM